MLRWKQVRLTTCVCGAELHGEKLDAFSTDLQRLLSAPSDSRIRALTLSERWRLAWLLGALSQFGLQGKPLKKASRQASCVERLLVSDGATLIDDRTICFDMFNRLRVPFDNAGNLPLLPEVFPHLLPTLRKQLSEAARAWMLGLLDAYVAYSSLNGSPILWERKGILANGFNSDRAKVRSSTIAAMLPHTGSSIPTRQTGTGRQKFLVSQSTLKEMRSARNSFVRIKGAARYAGISVERIRALVAANLVVTNGRCVDRRSIDRLVGRIANSSVRSAQELDEPIGLSEALRRYVSVTETARFFDQVVCGNVRMMLQPSEGLTLRGASVDRIDVMSLARTWAPPHETQISIVEAARRLAIKQEVVYHLISIGLLKTRSGKLSRRACRVVDLEDLEAFSAQFMPLCVVARTKGISSRDAPDWATRQGMEIVTGPSVDGSRQYWIRRRRECESPEHKTQKSSV